MINISSTIFKTERKNVGKNSLSIKKIVEVNYLKAMLEGHRNGTFKKIAFFNFLNKIIFGS